MKLHAQNIFLKVNCLSEIFLFNEHLSWCASDIKHPQRRILGPTLEEKYTSLQLPSVLTIKYAKNVLSLPQRRQKEH